MDLEKKAFERFKVRRGNVRTPIQCAADNLLQRRQGQRRIIAVGIE